MNQTRIPPAHQSGISDEQRELEEEAAAGNGGLIVTLVAIVVIVIGAWALCHDWSKPKSKAKSAKTTRVTTPTNATASR
jgi:hypothetical protein